MENELTYERIIDLMAQRGWERSPCAFCGGDDARHRVADAIVDRLATGESRIEVLADYGLDR